MEESRAVRTSFIQFNSFPCADFVNLDAVTIKCIFNKECHISKCRQAQAEHCTLLTNSAVKNLLIEF